MSQSLSNVLVHAAFSTQNRVALLDDAIRPSLHAYLGGTLRKLISNVVVVGGYVDHVHLFFALSRTHSISETIGKTKSASSKWLKEQSPKFRSFAWQQGYGVFSIGPSERSTVIRYIENQAEHHGAVSYQDEMRELFRIHDIPFNEAHVWK